MIAVVCKILIFFLWFILSFHKLMPVDRNLCMTCASGGVVGPKLLVSAIRLPTFLELSKQFDYKRFSELCLSVCLSVYLSVSLSDCVSLSLSVCLSVCLCLSLSLSLSVPISKYT